MNDKTARSGQAGKLFSSPLLGFLTGALGIGACACGFDMLMTQAQPARMASVPLALASIACGIAYLVGFRRQLVRHQRDRTGASGRAREREILATSWAVVVACIGTCLGALALSWLFL